MVNDPIGVLFVCHGNICRSPIAESVFRHLARQRGVDHLFHIDSAGTSGYHAGDPPDSRSVATARGRGVIVEGRSRQVRSSDLERFHYIIVMDGENLSGVREIEMAPGSPPKVHLLREWDPVWPGGDVPDPYYGGPRGFDDVHDIVERSCERLLEHLLTSSDRR